MVKEAKRDPALQRRLGKCYELAYKYCTSNSGWALVHGYIHEPGGDNRVIDHAWCEKGDLVYDAVLDKELPKIFYYKMFRAEIGKFYGTKKDIYDMALKYETYGPWHEIDDSKLNHPDLKKKGR